MNRIYTDLRSRCLPSIKYIRLVGAQLIDAADRRVWCSIIVTVSFVFAGSATASIAPLALKDAIDYLATPLYERSLSTVVGRTALYVGALLFQRVCEQIQVYYFSRGEQRIVRNFAEQTYAHLLTLPLTVHLEKRSGALGQTLSQGVEGLRLMLTHIALTVLPLFIQLVVAGVVLGALLGIKLGSILIFTIAVYCVVFAVGVARMNVAIVKISGRQIEAGGIAADGLMNIESVKAFTAERRTADRYGRVLEDAEKYWTLFSNRRFSNGITVAIVFALSLSTILFLVETDIAAASTAGGFVLINTYALQLIRPVEAVGFAMRDISQGAAYLKEVGMLLEIAPEPSAEESAPLPNRLGAAELQFENVCFGFGSRATVQDVSFTVAPGTMIGIVGPSGAGKSTVIRLIMRFFDPHSGRILFDGKPLNTTSLYSLRRQVALVSQDTILFNATIGENISFAVDRFSPGEVLEAAKRAHLGSLVAILPDGLDTLVGERGLRLSGGEKQRVSIARVALKRARLIIFDEATAALDSSTEQSIWKAIDSLSQGATTIVVTHRLATVKEADQLLVMDHGRVVERGTHLQLLDRGGLYWRLWESQSLLQD